jgi:hypothetical protein
MSENSTRIKTIRIRGFKGFTRDYELDGPTLISGPNEAGKSAGIEGALYCLGGKSPDGSLALEGVAEFFPPDGGNVKLIDESGAWIVRGFKKKKGKSGKREGDFKTSPGSDWATSPHVLDVKSLSVSGSAEERRRGLMSLAAEGKTPKPADLLKEIETAFVKHVGGPGSELSIFRNLDELPDALHDTLYAWKKPKGVREVVESVITKSGVDDVGPLFATLSEECRVSKNAARKAAQEAEASLETMAQAIEPHRAKANSANVKEQRKAQRKSDHETALAHNARRSEAFRAVEDATETVEKREGILEEVCSTFDKMDDPGPEPEEYEVPKEDIEQLEAFDVTIGREDDLLSGIEDLASLKEEAGKAGKKHLLARRAVESESLTAHAQLKNALDQIAGREIHMSTEDKPFFHDLLQAAGDVVEEWRTQTDLMDRLCEEANKEEEDAIRKVGEKVLGMGFCAEDVHRFDEIERDARERHRIAADGRTDLMESHKSAKEVRDARRRDWINASNTYQNAKAEIERAEKSLAEAKEDLAKKEERFYGFAGEIDADAISTEVDQLEEECKDATASKGVLDEYERMGELAFSKRTEEGAWKAAEEAVKRAREKHVDRALKPMLAEINAFLKAAGRPEEAFCDLVGEGKKQVFRIGWIKTSGEAVPAQALSAAATAIFMAALSVAVTRRSKGRRVLMVEADPLRDENRDGLLRALSHFSPGFDALIVATSRPVSEVPGWKVIHLD